MVSPTTSGDEPEDGVGLFSASRAATVELSTPPLMATAIDIDFDAPPLPIDDYRLQVFLNRQSAIENRQFPYL
jgi:hypothetical protein